MTEDLDQPEPQEPIHGVFTDVATAVISPPKWIIENLIPTGLTFIGGPPKFAKKSTLLHHCAALVAGYDSRLLPKYLCRAKREGTVLVFTPEATAGSIRYELEEGLGLELEADESFLVADDAWIWRLDDEDGLARLMHWIKEIDPVLIGIDPLRDFHSLEEKDSGEMNRLLRPLRQEAIKNDRAVVIVHHSAKPAERGQK